MAAVPAVSSAPAKVQSTPYFDPFAVPVSMLADGNTTDPGVAVNRSRNDRKSLTNAERRVIKQEREESMQSKVQKSQSAGDLPSFRIRASASVSASFANGTVPSNLPQQPNSNNTRLSGIEPSVDNSGLATAPTRSTEAHQRYYKAESAAALNSLSTSAMQDLGASMNALDSSAEGDIGRKLAHRERRFRRLFRNVPMTEVLLCRYSCAYVSAGLLLQGHMYVSNRWICFHSNVFGIEKIIEIPAESVTAVSKANTAKIIPNAVKIKTEGKSYLFGSLISRDNTYRLLINVTSIGRGRDDSGSSSKFDFTGGPYGNVSRSLRECADEFDEVTSSTTSLSTTSSSSPGADGNRPKAKMVRASTPALHVGAVEQAEPIVWKRPFHSGSETQLRARSNDAVDRSKGKENGLRKLPASKSSIPALLTWFFGLPKTLIILIICVGLVMFLFFCATFLTIRLIYIRNSNAFRADTLPWDYEHTADNILLSNRALDDMGNVLDNSLKVMDQVKSYLESLRLQVRNGLDDVANLSNPPGNVDETS